MSKILTKRQLDLLDKFSQNNLINRNFYLSGGTALSEFYLNHRISEDLDFFSTNEFNAQDIYIYLNSLKKTFNIVKIDFQQSFNRNLFFLHYIDNEIIKLEFTYYPFIQISNGIEYKNIKIDSILDIATNKIFTIYQNPRTRDFIDLFLIIQKYNYNFKELIKKAQAKFDWFVDPLQLGSQLMKVYDIKNYPSMVIPINDQDWQIFFKDEALNLKENVIAG